MLPLRFQMLRPTRLASAHVPIPWVVLALLAMAFLGRAATNSEVDFNLHIRPILSDHCFKCHGPDAQTRKAKLRLDRREDATQTRDKTTPIVPGHPDQSEVVRRIRSQDANESMPPPEAGLPLSAGDKEMLTRWIAAGANYQPHWALCPIRLPAVPEVQRSDLVRNPIDAFILARLEREGFSLSPPASPEKSIRRVTFDLTGLPPTLEEMDTFLSDPSPGAYENLVDNLLARETYGERMATEWLDVARYSDTYGYQVDRDRFVWPWRDWVIGAFNDNLPLDTFILWQLAGDLLPEATDSQILATAFNRLHGQNVEGGSVPEEFRMEYVTDRTQTFATAFLGLTLECARCHDHKYDPLSQKEYYQLTSFFSDIDEAGLHSYFTESIPTPTLVLAEVDQKKQLAEMAGRIQRDEAALKLLASEQAADFAAWLRHRPSHVEVPGEIGRFNFDARNGDTLTNLADEKTPATTPAANRLVPGHSGQALWLSGDDEVGFKFGNFKRHEPFSLAMWLNTPDVKERAVVAHRSQAWTDAGSRGYQVLIEEGKLSVSLVHFWPGNAIGVQTRQPIPTNTWLHFTITYDGSSRADGLKLYLNGQPAALEVVRDHLEKNIDGGGHDHLSLGARFRDNGFKGGQVDDLRVFQRELTLVEAAQLHQETLLSDLLVKPEAQLTPTERAWLQQYYLANVSAPYRDQLAKLRQSRQERNQLADALPEIMVMRQSPVPQHSYVLKRGAYDARGEEVFPETPAALPPMSSGASRNRLGLARWLIDPSHPLTARVLVNRYWQLFLGQGLVRTPNDFGSQGAPPTHPELLDWLAMDFMRSGWDLKRLARMIVTSSVYRQSSQASAALAAKDPQNLWLGRAPRYRLPAEMIRDNALSVSGLLLRKFGGPPTKPYDVAVSFKPVPRDKGEGLYRRSLYTYWKRNAPAPAMMALDASRRDVCSVRRDSTSSPLQAFVFLNDPQYVEAARKLAERTLQSTSLDTNRTARVLFRTLTGRQPNDREMNVLLALIGEEHEDFQRHPDRALALLKAGDAPRDAAIPAPLLAATTVLASALMNHDECVMKY